MAESPNPSGMLDELLQGFSLRGSEEAIVEKGTSYSYGDFEERRLKWLSVLSAQGIKPGQVVGIQSDFSLEALSLILALFANGNIVSLVPTSAGKAQELENLQDAEVQAFFRFNDQGVPSPFEKYSRTVTHTLLKSLQDQNRAGFVIFTSGSTGKPKAVLHDLEKFLGKFRGAKKKHRSLAFLLLDHIAGLDTLFYTFFSGGVLVLPQRRDPAHICQLIAAHRVEVLAVTPTFLNLLCLSGEYKRADLSSLKIIAYSSEPMSPHTLARVSSIFPRVEIMQKYGTSEFGSPRSRSMADDQLWLKLGSKDFQYKVVENILWVKASTTMLGYLNAPSPRTDDEGWVSTEDEVEVRGEWIRILGRKTETIIVGGEKVFPSEVESIILELEDIEDVAVRGESHPITGQIVTACVKLRDNYKVSSSSLVSLIRKHCRERLQPYKVPVKVHITDSSLAGERHKKLRR